MKNRIPSGLAYKCVQVDSLPAKLSFRCKVVHQTAAKKIEETEKSCSIPSCGLSRGICVESVSRRRQRFESPWGRPKSTDMKGKLGRTSFLVFVYPGVQGHQSAPADGEANTGYCYHRRNRIEYGVILTSAVSQPPFSSIRNLSLNANAPILMPGVVFSLTAGAFMGDSWIRPPTPSRNPGANQAKWQPG